MCDTAGISCDRSPDVKVDALYGIELAYKVSGTHSSCCGLVVQPFLQACELHCSILFYFFRGWQAGDLQDLTISCSVKVQNLLGAG